MLENQIYQKNIRQLEISNPVFANKIQEVSLQPEYEVFPAKKEGFSLKVKDILFHSKIAPLEEARKIAEKEDFSKQDLIIVGGAGLGYVLPILCNRYPDKQILYIEKSWQILKLAFQTIDFTQILSSGQTEIIVPDDLEAIVDYLRLYQTKKIGIVFHRPSYELYTDFYSEAKKLITRYLTTSEINQATLNRFEKLWFKNLILNMGAYIRTKGVNALFGQFNGRPVFLIGAGPSLRKQLEILKMIQRHYVLIAVNTSLPYLISNGIYPDFVVTVDPQDKVYRYFLPVNRLNLTKFPVLIAEPTISPKIVKNYPGITLFCNVGFLKNWVGQFSGDKGEIEMGGSVITAAFMLALKMGAGPIVFLGTDMSYSEKTLHFRGAELEKEWLFTQNKLDPQEGKQVVFIGRMRLFPHEGFFGQTVYTDSKFITYIQWLEKNFKKYPDAWIINATGGGIRFQGIENKKLEEVLEDLTQKKLNQKIMPDLNLLSGSFSEDREHFLQVLDRLGRELPPLKKTAKEGLEISQKLYDNSEKKIPVNGSLINRLNQIDEKISSFKLSEILSIGLQKIIQEVSEESEEQYTEKEKESKELKAFKSSLLIYSAICESVDYNLAQIKKAKQYLEFIKG